MNVTSRSFQNLMARPNCYKPRRKILSKFIDNARINRNPYIAIENDSIKLPEKKLHRLNGR